MLLDDIDQKIFCKACADGDFSNKSELIQHFDKHHGQRSRVKCGKCSTEVHGGIKNYLLHMASMHPNLSIVQGSGVVKIDVDAIERENPIEKDEDEMENEIFKIGKEQKCHFLRNTKTLKKNSEKRFHLFKKKRKNHNLNHTKTKVKCPTCNFVDLRPKIFAHIRETHFKKHLKEEIPSSETSKNRMDFADELLSDNPTIENESKSFKIVGVPVNPAVETVIGTTLVQCPDCELQLQQRCLQNHYKRLHIKEKSHKCPHCSECFFKRIELANHMDKCHQDKPTENIKKSPVEVKEHIDGISLVKCPKCDKVLQQR